MQRYTKVYKKYTKVYKLYIVKVLLIRPDRYVHHTHIHIIIKQISDTLRRSIIEEEKNIKQQLNSLLFLFAW